MRRTGILILGIMIFIGACGPKPPMIESLPYIMPIMDSSARSQYSFTELIDRLADADVVFIGEQHDDSLTHILEAQILKSLHERKKDVAVAMEMFERDVQNYVDAYTSGEIDEELFLEKTRPWGNYRKAYKPVLDFARHHRLKVLAMNVPRRIASRMAMLGMAGMAAISDSEKVFMAEELKVLDDEYKERFLEYMEGDTSSPMGRLDPERMYIAQSLKDDTMAETIHEYREFNPEVKIVSYQGDFHSAFGLGIVKKLRMLDPDVKTAVVSVVPVENLETAQFRSYEGRGDYIIFVQRYEQN
jgi:uncharacterized iron-regulated protein